MESYRQEYDLRGTMPTTEMTPRITFYWRPGCTLCDEAEALLVAVLATRAAAGDRPFLVDHVDIAGDPELEAIYGSRIPVIAIGSDEIELVTSARGIRALLERAAALPDPAA